jgi:EmrB/QacA subfamily drug resistance transporter
VATVCVGAFLGQLDASIVAVAIPGVRDDLGVGLGAAAWVSLSYLVVLVGTVAAIGRFADMVGRKALYTYGFAVFALASLGCALAPNLPVLIIFRVVQALGAAMLQANSVALLTAAVPAHRLARTISLQGVAQALGLSAGPLLGSLLVGLGGWRWVFFANLPAGALGFALGWFMLPPTRDRAPHKPFDWLGLALLYPAVSAALLSLSFLTRGWASPTQVAAVGALAALLVAAFIRRERRARAPMIDLSFVGRLDVGPGLAGTALAAFVMFGMLLVVPAAFADGGGGGLLSGGLALAVLPVAVVVAAPVAGLLTERVGARLPTTLGMALVATGLATAALVGSPGEAGGGGQLVVALGIAGVGLGLFVPPNNTSVMVVARACDTGMASGLLNMARGLGTAFGVAAGAAAYASGGFTGACLLLAAFAAGGVVLAAMARRSVPRAARPARAPQAARPARAPQAAQPAPLVRRGGVTSHLVTTGSGIGSHEHELARAALHRGRQQVVAGTANGHGRRVPIGIAAGGAGGRSASPQGAQRSPGR